MLGRVSAESIAVKIMEIVTQLFNLVVPAQFAKNKKQPNLVIIFVESAAQKQFVG